MKQSIERLFGPGPLTMHSFIVKVWTPFVPYWFQLCGNNKIFFSQLKVKCAYQCNTSTSDHLLFVPMNCMLGDTEFKDDKSSQKKIHIYLHSPMPHLFPFFMHPPFQFNLISHQRPYPYSWELINHEIDKCHSMIQTRVYSTQPLDGRMTWQ